MLSDIKGLQGLQPMKSGKDLSRALSERRQRKNIMEESGPYLSVRDDSQSPCVTPQLSRSPSRRSSSIIGTDAQGNRVIKVHHYTADPTAAWDMLKTRRPVKKVRPMPLDTPMRNDAVRFVCIGCSHGLPLDDTFLPEGDVLIVAGDFTTCGLPDEIKLFNESIASLCYKHVVVIAGNNELSLDPQFMRDGRDRTAKEMGLRQAISASLVTQRISSSLSLLTNCHYLEDGMIELYGIKIYGTPWQPSQDQWAFNLDRGQPLLDKWNKIPKGVDVLITHTPPVGHGDIAGNNNTRMGCVELLNSVVKRIRPKYHVFAKEHAGYGCTSDGYTKFINCSLCDSNTNVRTTEPVIFDIRSEHKTTTLFDDRFDLD